jgi:hypothetical protein
MYLYVLRIHVSTKTSKKEGHGRAKFLFCIFPHQYVTTTKLLAALTIVGVAILDLTVFATFA